MSTVRDKLNQLTAQRELLELEADAITSELTSLGPNGEPPIGIKGTFVDAEGFPRSDIDIYRARNQRNRLSVINTDHKALMKEIERFMHLAYMESASTSSSTTENSGRDEGHAMDNSTSTSSSNIVDSASLVPYAIIDEILPDSPAETAGLQNGDKLLSFHHITSSTPNALVSIPAVVRDNIGKAIPLMIRRHTVDMSISLVPQVWSGRGVLGCHLTPIMM